MKKGTGFLLLEAVFSTISLQAKTDEPFDLNPEFKADSAETEDAVLPTQCAGRVPTD